MKTFLLLSAVAIVATVSAQAGSPLQSTLDKYIQIQTALAGDSLKGVPEAAAEIAGIAKSSDGVVPANIAERARAVGAATGIKAAREAFKPLSTALIQAVTNQKSLSGDYYEAFCPMANASWIQTGKKVSNPYFGSGMLGCGEIRKAIGGAPQASLPAKSGMGCCGS